jgi:hypothetical protein
MFGSSMKDALHVIGPCPEGPESVIQIEALCLPN